MNGVIEHNIVARFVCRTEPSATIDVIRNGNSYGWDSPLYGRGAGFSLMQCVDKVQCIVDAAKRKDRYPMQCRWDNIGLFARRR